MNRLLLLALIISNVIWIAVTINRATALDDYVAESQRSKETLALSLQVASALGEKRPRAEVVQLLGNAQPRLVIKIEGDTLEVGSLRIEFDSAGLKVVEEL